MSLAPDVFCGVSTWNDTQAKPRNHHAASPHLDERPKTCPASTHNGSKFGKLHDLLPISLPFGDLETR